MGGDGTPGDFSCHADLVLLSESLWNLLTNVNRLAFLPFSGWIAVYTDPVFS